MGVSRGKSWHRPPPPQIRRFPRIAAPTWPRIALIRSGSDTDPAMTTVSASTGPDMVSWASKSGSLGRGPRKAIPTSGPCGWNTRCAIASVGIGCSHGEPRRGSAESELAVRSFGPPGHLLYERTAARPAPRRGHKTRSGGQAPKQLTHPPPVGPRGSGCAPCEAWGSP